MNLDEIEEYAYSLGTRFNWRAIAFDKQIKAIEDPWRLKALFTTRRGAKSFTDGIYLLKEASENPGTNCLYLGLTKGSAVGIIWKDILIEIIRKCNIDCTVNLTEHSITLANGSVIYISGVDVDEDERKKLFGRKYKLVVLDEAALYGIDLRDLIYVVLRPSLVDMRGTCVLSGMASDITHGLFYDITVGKEQGWSLHTWTAHDNPHVSKQWQEELEFIAKHQPALMGTARFRQAYLNEWVVDQEKLVYKFNPKRNLFSELPYPHSKGWTFNLGVDTGWEDDNAFVLSAYHENEDSLYILKCYKKNHMYFDHLDPNLSVRSKIKEYMNDPEYPVSQVIIDGANKQGVETMNIRGDIPFTYADKQGKADHIEICNGDLLLGKIKIHTSCTDLIDEMQRLVWKTDGDRIVIPRKEHPNLPNHLCDAFLYGWFNGWHFLSHPAKKAALPGTPEYIKEQEDLHKQAIAERLKQESLRNHPSSQGMTWQKDQFGRDPWHNWND
jgi:phage terminase large subunit